MSPKLRLGDIIKYIHFFKWFKNTIKIELEPDSNKIFIKLYNNYYVCLIFKE
jgi:hypothetical protein